MDFFPSHTLISVFAGTALLALVALVTSMSRKGRTEDQARAYLAGVTYVLSGDPDGAIAELSKAAQLNRQTIETYFALGTLFRRKGELDRAIRLHCNIALSPGLADDVKRRALLALAMDYKISGLLDKAGDTLQKILNDEPGHKEALLRYRQILEETKDWAQAVEVQVRLTKLDNSDHSIIAHLLAEHSRSLLAVAPGEAEQVAQRATAMVPSCANAQLVLGEARLAQGKTREAAVALKQALTLEPELAPKTVRSLALAMEDRGAVKSFLTDKIAQNNVRGAAFELALAFHYREEGARELALWHLRRLVEQQPRFLEARKELGKVLLEQNHAEELRADYEDILKTLGQPAMGFVCRSCAQKLPEYVFRCPLCENWETVEREHGQMVRQVI